MFKYKEEVSFFGVAPTVDGVVIVEPLSKASKPQFPQGLAGFAFSIVHPV